ncbi:hypothetical protein SORBI_3009G249301 [Sorghum bicolor]|uniref:Uncharacterized protein n=1 Tax=Sorghum bicolor TaxID=4558 RepID=A0A1Z5R3Y6_SORBI|nr:hypothetical protein SORBI_3009G249301 [Sorghum bicolor]
MQLGAVFASRRQPLADQLADVVGAVRHQPRRRRRRRRLQQQRLQVRELFVCDGGLVEELEAGGLRRARITTACGSTAPAAAGGLRTPGLLLDGVWREGRAGMEGEEEAVGGRRSGVWGEGGAVGGRVGARWRRGVGEREAASGTILAGLRLEFKSSPKMRGQVAGPLEFSNSMGACLGGPLELLLGPV